MKIHRLTSLFLALALQLMPLCREVLVQLAPGGTAALAMVRWMLGAAVLLGECHAVSGASTAITSPLNVRGTNGMPFNYRITSSPDVANQYAAAPLPPGLAVSTTTGYISGTPTASGTWSVSLTASDRGLADRTATALLTLKIQDAIATNGAPWITTQPQNQNVVAGSNAIFYVAAGGAAPLGYQWRFGDTDLASQTSPLLPLNAVTPAQAGSYCVVVTNAAGAVTSAFAMLTVSTNSPRPPAPLLTLVTNGAGSILPSVSLRLIKAGTACALTAVPAPGQIFNGWSGSLTATSTVVRVTLASNLVLQANFIPSPYIPAAGYYAGLFAEADQVRQSSAGRFALQATSRGTYSGWLQIGAARYAFQGHLDLQLQATNVIRRAGDVLWLRFQLGSGDQIDQVNGALQGTNWSATLSGDRATFSAATNPCPAGGTYTIVLPGRDDVPEWPIGDGYGHLRVSPSGRVVCAGTLADGIKFTQTALLSKQGAWPFYASLYGGKGSLMSWLSFADQPTDDLHGPFSWIKPPRASTRYYPNGFSAECLAVGSRYVAPVGASNSVLNFTNGSVALVGGNLDPGFTNSIVRLTGNRIASLSSNRCSVAFSLATGEFTGSAVNPSTGKLLHFGGVALQKPGYASGSFLGTNQSGRVTLRSVDPP